MKVAILRGIFSIGFIIGLYLPVEVQARWYQPPSFLSIRSALKKASELYVEIYCVGETHDSVIATGFPVAERRILTAFHVQCASVEDAMLVTTPDGRTHAETVRADQKLDLRLLQIGSSRYRTYARFKQATVGDFVVGRSAALQFEHLGGIVGFGIIMGQDDVLIITSNLPLGGTSGTALVNMDGYVVGISIGSLRDSVSGALVNVAVRARIIEDFLRR